jgi:hypothetical protein
MTAPSFTQSQPTAARLKQITGDVLKYASPSWHGAKFLEA